METKRETMHVSHTSSELTFIDAHQHFWQYNAVRDNWITDDMAAIRKDFLPADLQPVLVQNSFAGSILVQSDQSEEHNEFLLQLAYGSDFIKGIVGWVDLQSENIRESLQYYQQFSIIKGFRHVLQGEQDRALMLKPAFMRGIKALQDFGYTYDILIFPDQLQYIPAFVGAFPDQKFVIDHIAKPNIKDHLIEDWQRDIAAVAEYKNVFCKISGMVTEADFKNWRKEDFTPYIDVVVKSFGIDRIMYGSDWPVCLVAGSYKEVSGIVKDYFSSFTPEEQAKVFGTNATAFYNL
ncbi:MAG TPA: amidohydrolase family protein [Segetibacter sp.]|jgi:L-fuconolactonase